MNPVVYIGISNDGGPWDCCCNSNGWYLSNCKFINFRLDGINLHYDIILPDGHIDKDKHHTIDCISLESYRKIILTLKFEDGTEKVFDDVRNRNSRTDLMEFLEEYNSNGYEIKIDHSYELDEGFDDI